MAIVESQRFDPYKNYKFKISIAGTVVAAVSKVSPLIRTTEVISHRVGGDPSTVYKAPGQSKYEAITLESGITTDTAFQDWANAVWNINGSETSLANFRKNMTLDVYTEDGSTIAVSYKILNCWVSEYHALPELDANSSAVAIQLIKVENEGWELVSNSGTPRAAAIG